MMKDAGYATGAFGKWGLGYPCSEGDPTNLGFDEFFGYNCQRQAHHYYPYHLWHNQEKVMLPGNEGSKTETYAQDLIQEKALQFIVDNQSKPFFCICLIFCHMPNWCRPKIPFLPCIRVKSRKANLMKVSTT